ncbi:MAG: hypothetical protein J7493_03110 [Porphyrobacter sp.]|nr:hypothetical protein [Porphyrobacter sp.]
MAETAATLNRPAVRATIKWGGAILLAASFAFIGERFWRLDWSSLQPHLSGAFLLAIAGAGLLFGLADHALAQAWRTLADPERSLHSRTATSIYGRGVLMKYLPGSVFQYLGRQVGGATAGLEHGRMARSSVTEVLLHLVASFSVAVVCLLLDMAPIVALTVAGAMGIAAYSSRRSLVTSLVWQFAAFFGFALAAVLIGATVLPAGSSLFHFAGLFLLAWLAGFVVPIAPGGIGVREAALLALAGAHLPAANLLAAVLALRLASIGGDLAYGLIALSRNKVSSL